MLRNERGFVLPLMLAITFMAASLLLMLSMQLEVKVASYERTRDYVQMNLLEQKGLDLLAEFLQTMDIDDSFSDTWTLRSGAIMRISATRVEETFDFYYQIMYNGHVRSKSFLFCFEEGIMFLD